MRGNRLCVEFDCAEHIAVVGYGDRIHTEAYIAPNSRLDRTKTSNSDAAYHLLLLAENNAGYQNLLKLATVGYTEGFYYRPRIDKQILAELNDGLIACSACPKGELAMQLANSWTRPHRQPLKNTLKYSVLKDTLSKSKATRMMSQMLRNALVELANKLGIGLVATK